MTTPNTPDSNEQQGEAISEVAQCAQAVLTALNVGDVQSGSPLHLKLREVMIAYRERVAVGPALTDERVDAFIREHENDPVDEAQLERVRQRFKEKLASPAAASPAPASPQRVNTDFPFDDYCAGGDCRACTGVNCTCQCHAPIANPESLHATCRRVWVCKRCGNCLDHCQHKDESNFHEDLAMPCSAKTPPVQPEGEQEG